MNTIPPIPVAMIATTRWIVNNDGISSTSSSVFSRLCNQIAKIENNKNMTPVKKYFKFMFNVLFPKKIEVSSSTASLIVSPFYMLINKSDQLISHGLLLFNIRMTRRIFIGEDVNINILVVYFLNGFVYIARPW